MGRRKDLGKHRDESTSFRGTRFFRDISRDRLPRSIWIYFFFDAGEWKGRWERDTIYDGGSNMIFDREKISGFEWI